MSKKVIGLIMAGTLMLSIVGCGNKAKEEANNPQKPRVAVAAEDIESNVKTKGLEGEWANKTYTYKNFKEEGTALNDQIEKLSTEYGLKFEKTNEVTSIEGATANISRVYLENENPEPNRLESMQFEMQMLGESQESGRFQLTMSLKLNGEGVKKGEFNLGETSLAKYASILTGVNDYDYSNINKKIEEVVKSSEGEGFVENSINGVHVEIGVNKDYLTYKLTTPAYKFVEEPAPITPPAAPAAPAENAE